MTIAEETHASGAKPLPAEPTDTKHRTRRRGFAAMPAERVREIASKGGKAAHAAGTAHQFNSDEARNAGRKGGMAPHVRRGGIQRHVSPGGEPVQSPDSADSSARSS